jgi:methylphosphotriester-DNA--protein-cysteine methyltransferase
MDGDNTQEETVFDRLLQYASKLTEKKKLQEQLARRPIDPNTGRMFFRPHTGRKPQSDVRSSSHPSGKAAYVLSSRSGGYQIIRVSNSNTNNCM